MREREGETETEREYETSNKHNTTFSLSEDSGVEIQSIISPKSKICCRTQKDLENVHESLSLSLSRSLSLSATVWMKLALRASAAVARIKL